MRRQTVALLLCLAPGAAVGGNIHVPGDRATIQEGIDAAIDGDTILLQPGDYLLTAPLTFRGKAVTVRPAILSEETIVRVSESPSDPTRGSVVIFESGEPEGAAIESVTITGGRGTKMGTWDSNGAGILCVKSSSPTIRNCRIYLNRAASGVGGGLYCDATSGPRLVDCRFEENQAYQGGGVYNAGSSRLTLEGCTFLRNQSPYSGGGGMYNSAGDPMVRRCAFLGNQGGDIRSFSSEGGGGGLYNMSGSPWFVTCLFSGNASVNNVGGAVRNFGAGSPKLINCTFSGNSAAGNLGGGIFIDRGGPTVYNCVLWGNEDKDGQGSSAQIYVAGGTPVVSFSCVQDEDPGDTSVPFGGASQRNIDDDPLFIDADGTDGILGTADDSPRLAPTSPCVDAGDNGGLLLGNDGDLDGDPRFVDMPAIPDTGDGSRPIVDMGAYECPKQGILVSAKSIVVPEGGTAAFTVALAMDPLITVEVSVARKSGDPDIQVREGGLLVFDSTNYSSPQTVTLECAQDWDSFDGSAEISITAAVIRADMVTAREGDNETFPTIFYVDGENGSDSSDGLLPETAFATIARAVAVATDGDLVVVADGSYSSNEYNDPVVDFRGKAITVRSERGPRSCVLRGGDCVVRFASGEGPESVLEGFTVTGGDPGAGICCEGASPTISNNVVTGNWSEYGMGAVWLESSRAVLLGNLIAENRVYGPCAGVVCSQQSVATIVNCTIASNGGEGQDEGPGAVYCEPESAATIVNCIAWDNGDRDTYGACTVTYSCLEHGAEGEGNIQADPKFVGDGDFRLQVGSPAVDAGTAAGAPPVDMDGVLRPCGAGVDMGAFELGDCREPVGTRYQRGNANADANLDITDAIAVLNFLFLGGSIPCVRAGDADDDGQVIITDGIFILNYLFLGGPAPKEPLGTCGEDPTPDDLTCERFDRCS